MAAAASPGSAASSASRPHPERCRPQSAQSFFAPGGRRRARSTGFIDFEALSSDEQGKPGALAPVRPAAFRLRALSPAIRHAASPCRDLFGLQEEPSAGAGAGTGSAASRAASGPQRRACSPFRKRDESDGMDTVFDGEPQGKFRALTGRGPSPTPIKAAVVPQFRGSQTSLPCSPVPMLQPSKSGGARPRFASAGHPPTLGFGASKLAPAPNRIGEPIQLPCANEPTLRGDGRRCSLPALSGTAASHADLRCIAPATLVEVLDGGYKGRGVDDFVIIDCRYPFEYEGGHIEGAYNLWTMPILEAFLFERNIRQLANDGRTVIIFHCEFSSHRAPQALKWIRNLDRSIHLSSYPALFFPELYVLEGGYKRFYESFPGRCVPHSYVPMVDPRFEREHLEAQRTTRKEKERARKQKNAAIAALTAGESAMAHVP